MHQKITNSLTAHSLLSAGEGVNFNGIDLQVIKRTDRAAVESGHKYEARRNGAPMEVYTTPEEAAENAIASTE